MQQRKVRAAASREQVVSLLDAKQDGLMLSHRGETLGVKNIAPVPLVSATAARQRNWGALIWGEWDHLQCASYSHWPAGKFIRKYVTSFAGKHLTW